MKTKNLLILCFMCISFGHAQIVTIPDANFKNDLVNTLCVDLDGDYIGDDDVDTNNDGEIQVSEALAVLHLNVSKSIDTPDEDKILSLDGIEAFSNLIYLGVNSNLLTALDVSNQLNIEIIFCWDNDLNEVDLTQNPNLRFIGLMENPILELDVTQNPNLEFLLCGSGSETLALSELDVTQNPQLRSLHVYNSSLEDIDLGQNKNLVNLVLRKSKLTSLDLSNNLLLENLDFTENSVSSINVSQNALLETIRGSSNPITDIDVSSQLYLEDFNFSETQIASVDLSNNENLKFIDVSNNNVLHTLNVQNGNNTNITAMIAQDNPNLACIQVDNAGYPESVGCYAGPFGNQEGWCNDNGTHYSENCLLGINEFGANNITIYPNPASHTLNIRIEEGTAELITLYTALGQFIASFNNTKEVSIENFANGLYLIEVMIHGEQHMLKFLKE